MKDLIRRLIVVALAGVYVITLYAVLHPRFTPGYRAFYIDRTSSDWAPVRYAGTPEEGITFGRRGVPEWVDSIRGLSVRDDWGRWTDEDLGNMVELKLNRPLSGDVCVDMTARAVPWIVGQPFIVRMVDESQTLRVASQELSRYRAQFVQLPPSNRLDILLPPTLPPARAADPQNADMRRLGLNLATLRILPGYCPSGGMGAVASE